MNKVFAFGADYVRCIEKVYGHLHIARENVAIVLGDRVDRQLMDLDEAKQVLKAWFYDNPKQFYGI
jgi:predicted RNA methylase